MSAWYATKPSEKATLNRSGQIAANGGRAEFPPLNAANWLATCLQEVGFHGLGMSGPEPLSAVELRQWADGSETVLGGIDFQDILDASRVFVSGYHEFSEKYASPPWSPEMTPEEEAQAAAALERAWDMAMGVS